MDFMRNRFIFYLSARTSTWCKRRYLFQTFIRNMASAQKGKEIMANVSSDLIRKWDDIHNDFQNKIINCDTEAWQTSPELSGLRRVAGVDISIAAKDQAATECEAVVGVVICEFPSMEIILEETEQVHLTVPYIPGYLAFRESPPAVALISRIVQNHPDKVPDVLLVDGNGVLHPQKCGLASHIGVSTSLPTIGVAKNLHLIDGLNVNKNMLVVQVRSVGDHVLIRNESNEVLGMALKTANDTKNPMYVSVGHKISLETAKKVVLKCSRYRVPDPIRFADNISREIIRQKDDKSQTDNKDKD